MGRTMLTVVAVLFISTGSASAHHGSGGFDLQHPVTIEGTVTSIIWANPHAVMAVRVSDGTVYQVRWQLPTASLSFIGITKTTFNIGDHLIITAAPSRDPKLHELQMVQAVQRPSDGWSWHDTAK